MKMVPLEKLAFESFAGLVKTTFRVWIDAQDSLELGLSEITPRRVTSIGGKKAQAYENFTLVFLGPVNRLLSQRIYLFESAQLGRFELFIVPVGRNESHTHYEAIFNRLVETGL
jgi:hypothetical protein